MKISSKTITVAAVLSLLGCMAACQPKQGVHLVVIGGADKGQDLVVRGRRPVTIGRYQDSDLHLTDEHVSRRHAVIVPAATGYALTDVGTEGKGSTNGTSLQGSRLAPQVPSPLHSGDVIDIGGASQVRFEDLSEK